MGALKRGEGPANWVVALLRLVSADKNAVSAAFSAVSSAFCCLPKSSNTVKSSLVTGSIAAVPIEIASWSDGLSPFDVGLLGMDLCLLLVYRK